MPVAIPYVPSRVGGGHFRDWQVPVSGDNGKSVMWDHAQSKYVPAAFEASGAVAAHVALADPHTQYLLASGYTAADVLTKLLTVDGSGTGLDADLLDGQHAAAFAASGHAHDHGALTGLGDDDHAQYLLASGSRNGAATIVASGINATPLTLKMASDQTVPGFSVVDSSDNPLLTVDTYNGYGIAGVGLPPSEFLGYFNVKVPSSDYWALAYLCESNNARWINWIEDGSYGGESGSLYYDGGVVGGQYTIGAVVFGPSGRLGINIGYTEVGAGLHIICGDTAIPGALIKLHANSSAAMQVKSSSDVVVFDMGTDGKTGIGTSPTISDGVGVDINGKILRLRTQKTPANATATGNAGEICADSNYIYYCVGTNQWKRSALSTW